MEHAFDLKSPCIQVMNRLIRPTTGNWLEVLYALDTQLGHQVNASLLPMGHIAGQLTKDQRPAPALQAWFEGGIEKGIFSSDVFKYNGIFGYFSALVHYRNKIFHSGQKLEAFYDEMGPLLFNATLEAIANPLLLGGCLLAVSKQDASGSWNWFQLSGMGSIPLSIDTGDRRFPDPSQQENVLFLVSTGFSITLHPFVVFQEREEIEYFGFLKETVIRRKATPEGEKDSHIKRVEYVDYGTGASFQYKEANDSLMAFLSKLNSGLNANTENYLDQLGQGEDESESVKQDVSTGTYLGDYELLEKLGEGGMGEVFRAKHRTLQRIVAVKVLPMASCKDPVAWERFRREIHALGKCEHPNIVDIYSSGVENNRYYYVMEYVQGADLGRVNQTLSDWKSKGLGFSESHILKAISMSSNSSVEKSVDFPGIPNASPEPAPEIERSGDFYRRVALLFADAARGLEHIHSKNIIHRDIKPDNLMLTADGNRLVIMDLGLAKISDASRQVTDDKVKVLGTLAYMAPEQLTMQLLKIDHRVDIYGLGVCLYETITGKRFLREGTAEQLMEQVLNEEPIPVRSHNSEVPRDLAIIIHKAISRNKKHRYACAKDLAEDLSAFCQYLPIRAKPPSLLNRLELFTHRNKSAVVAFASALLVLSLTAAGIWYFQSLERKNKLRKTVSYCASIEEKWGTWSCAVPLKKSDVPFRMKSFRVTKQGNLIKLVEKINGKGIRIDDSPEDGPNDSSYWEYPKQDGLVRLYSPMGKLLKQYQYRDISENVKRRDRENALGVPDKPGKRFLHRNENIDGAQYTREIITYNQTGCIAKRMFFDQGNNPQRDESLNWGYSYVRNFKCQKLMEFILDQNGNPTVNRQSIQNYRYFYDEAGRVVGWANIGVNGEWVYDTSGCAGGKNKYDSQGNLLESWCLGSDRKPVNNKEGYSGIRNFYDQGNLIERWYLNPTGKLTLHKEGNAVWKKVYDARGNETERWFFGLEGELVSIKEGYSGDKRIFDEKGFLIERSFWGTDRKPIIYVNGYHKQESIYNENGNETTRRFYDIYGKPIITKYGHAGWTSVFEQDNEIERCYRGLNSEKIINSDWFACQKTKYFEGTPYEEWYFDKTNNRTFRKEGYAGYKMVFDKNGNTEEFWHYGKDGARISLRDGMSGNKYKYKNGLIVWRGFYDASEKLKRNVRGYAGWESTYNSRGNETAVSYFDENEKPTVANDGTAGFAREFDERSNVIRITYFGVNKEPARNLDGIGGWTAVFDKAGNETERWYVDLKGLPAKSKEDGCFGRVRKYDNKGNMVESWCYDEKKKLLKGRDGVAGWKTIFDENSNEVEKWYYNTDGKIGNNRDGYSGRVSKYTKIGKPEQTCFYDSEKKPMDINGWHCLIYKYDDRGNVTKFKFVGRDGKLILTSKDIAGFKSVYSQKNQEIEQWFFGQDEKVKKDVSGIAGWKVKYDDWGSELERWFFDEKGNLANHLDGFAGYVKKYNEHGKEVEQWFYNAEKQFVTTKDGFSGITKKYDSLGNEIERWVLLEKDKLVLTNAGYSGWKNTFDGYNLIRIEFFGLERQPVNIKDGYSTVVIKWDEKGPSTKEYYDVAGMKVK